MISFLTHKWLLNLLLFPHIYKLSSVSGQYLPKQFPHCHIRGTQEALTHQVTLLYIFTTCITNNSTHKFSSFLSINCFRHNPTGTLIFLTSSTVRRSSSDSKIFSGYLLPYTVFVLQSPAYLPVYLAPGVYGRASAESSITLLLVNLLIETQVIPEHITMSVHRTFLCIFHRCMALIRRQQTAYPSADLLSHYVSGIRAQRPRI